MYTIKNTTPLSQSFSAPNINMSKHTLSSMEDFASSRNSISITQKVKKSPVASPAGFDKSASPAGIQGESSPVKSYSKFAAVSRPARNIPFPSKVDTVSSHTMNSYNNHLKPTLLNAVRPPPSSSHTRKYRHYHNQRKSPDRAASLTASQVQIGYSEDQLLLDAINMKRSRRRTLDANTDLDRSNHSTSIRARLRLPSESISLGSSNKAMTNYSHSTRGAAISSTNNSLLPLKKVTLNEDPTVGQALKEAMDLDRLKGESDLSELALKWWRVQKRQGSKDSISTTGTNGKQRAMSLRSLQSENPNIVFDDENFNDNNEMNSKQYQNEKDIAKDEDDNENEGMDTDNQSVHSIDDDEEEEDENDNQYLNDDGNSSCSALSPRDKYDDDIPRNLKEINHNGNNLSQSRLMKAKSGEPKSV